MMGIPENRVNGIKITIHMNASVKKDDRASTMFKLADGLFMASDMPKTVVIMITWTIKGPKKHTEKVSPFTEHVFNCTIVCDLSQVAGLSLSMIAYPYEATPPLYGVCWSAKTLIYVLTGKAYLPSLANRCDLKKK